MAVYSNAVPCPRSFECSMCGEAVVVTERSDHRMRFCCEHCEKRYWKHADGYERRKASEAGHVMHGWREAFENRREEWF